MKRVEAVIPREKFQELQEALGSDVERIVVTECRVPGHGTELFRGTEYDVSLVGRTMVIAYVRDDALTKCVRLMRDASATPTANDGDCYVSVSDVEVLVKTSQRSVEKE